MEIKSLIDPEGGLVDRRIFADREIYELERERVFARCWLYLGHAGVLFRADAAEELIEVVRDLHR